ncbi:MAG: sulfide/dihydroorotate dehydrogenase-like FAD/NAD-binding protein [Candidatus Bathyarchaeota archaeon]|jgi:ferredoxin--NADP+ reductase|nr:sulfide/dihydroorotate dehydrogenase-like FAD/NAD-binding protein [Candidatus Bathyarchaeota archaeon A05DMB-3]MDH7607504.1 sulfide/dihydroorotate dehydrogenase-like FAD/NAD-binding protein [Candidatus Bathyarchaeota archaeon]
MYKIVKAVELAPKIKLFEVYAPQIAEKACPGQFIIVIIDEKGERVPLTIAGYDADKGTITFVFNEVGKTTKQLGLLKEGDFIANITGPLGNPSEIRSFGKVLCVAGGVMIAPMLLQVKALRETGNTVVTVLGARIKELLFFKEEMKALSHRLYVATDDGSEGYQGMDFLKDILAEERFDRCIAMGPVPMLKVVCDLTKPYKIPTIVTLMPIMVDGMGMCGVCRVNVGGQMKFGCVDGPEFDGHLVDFDGLIKRQRMFLPEERLSALLWELGGCGCGGK